MINIIVVIAIILSGYISNVHGRIGIRCNHFGLISHVYTHSSAAESGLKVGDIILDADGKKGITLIDAGEPGTKVELTVKRRSFVFKLSVPRVPDSEVYDEKPVNKKVEAC